MSESISKRLERNIEKIMKEWETRALAEIESASSESKRALRDSLPEYLAQLALALGKTNTRKDARIKFDKSELTRFGKIHGKDRAESPNYTMDEMIFEYHILRQVLCDVLEEEEPLTDIQRELIVCSIEQAVNDAATEFGDSLKKLNTQLTEEKDLRDQFMAALSHDLRTPLTSIKMIAQILGKRSKEPEEVEKIAARVSTGVDRIDNMIQDLLDFTHFRAGEKLRFIPLLCNVNKIAQTTIDELTVIHGPRFELLASEQFDVVCDGKAITRILENLATNAIKYGAKTTPVTIKLEKHDETLNISVHNMGNPIGAKDMKLIFEPYKRTESAEQGAERGWGIGLTLVKGLAEAHGGKIKVESSKEGTTFTVSIPLKVS